MALDTPLLPEAWMRGPIPGVSVLIAPTLFSLQQAREDLGVYTNGLTTDQIWARPFGFAPAGFHIRHIGRSADRLTTYLIEHPLSKEQLALLQAELEPGESREELFAELEKHLERAEAEIRAIPEGRLAEPRGIGRKRLPSTVMGLIVHMAEHAQRHVGQAIAAAKLARAAS